MPKNLEILKDDLANAIQDEGVNLTRAQAFSQKKCVKCGDDAREFKDCASETEYRLTIWCQSCQDEFFG